MQEVDLTSEELYEKAYFLDIHPSSLRRLKFAYKDVTQLSPKVLNKRPKSAIFWLHLTPLKKYPENSKFFKKQQGFLHKSSFF